MPVPIQRLLSEHKLDTESLKKAFDAEKLLKNKDSPVAKLVDAFRDCIRQGIDVNRRDYRLFKAMDWSYDAPFYQISYTQLRGLLSKKPDDKAVQQTVKSWGLTHLLQDEIGLDGKPCCNADGSKKKALNLPVFTNVFVPVVMAYTTIRWAKLFNDIDLIPLYKYEPVTYTKENRLRCEVITQVVQKQASQFDYLSDEKQSILQMLLYGICINFPREAWFVEKQEDESGKEKIIKEGLRFNMPHPSRMYYDPYHRVSSLNSNSGCSYAGYWELARYKDIFDNKLYWNKDKIQYGGQSWFDIGRSDFLDEVFPCTLQFPNNISGNSDPGGVGGSGALDRQTDAAYYNSGDFQTATLLTQHFHRFVPADYGLGTYKHPVWFRFVFAADNAVLWAEPLGFDRFPTYAYDADFNRSRFRSLPLEIMPFQDQIGNLLSQWGRAVRENLRNPVFVDKEKVPEEYLRLLQNYGDKYYGGREFIPYSSVQDYRFKEDRREAFFTPTLTHHNTSEISQLISGMLDMLDRIMQLSPQEIGQAASHEQTAEESRIIAQNTSTRVAFTGSFRDSAIYAKKVMLYDAMMAYADDDITVGISTSLAATEEEFKKLIKSVGLTIDDDSTYDPESPDAMRTVKGKKSAIMLESFASTRDAANRINTPALADAMSKIFIAISNNPVLVQSIGAVQLVELLNQIILASGLPREFRLKGSKVDTTAGAEEQQGQLNELITQFAEQVKQSIGESQQQTIQAAGEQTQQIVGQALQQVAGQIGEQLTAIGEATAQANQVNQVQQQQIDQLSQAVAQLNQAVEAALKTAIQAAAPQAAPFSDLGGGFGGIPMGSVPMGPPPPPAMVPAGPGLEPGVPA